MEDEAERRHGSVSEERTSLQQPRGSVGGLGIDEWWGSSSCCSRCPASSLGPLLVPAAVAAMAVCALVATSAEASTPLMVNTDSSPSTRNKDNLWTALKGFRHVLK